MKLYCKREPVEAALRAHNIKYGMGDGGVGETIEAEIARIKKSRFELRNTMPGEELRLCLESFDWIESFFRGEVYANDVAALTHPNRLIRSVATYMTRHLQDDGQ